MMASSSIDPDQPKKHSEPDDGSPRSLEGRRQPLPPAMAGHPHYPSQHYHQPYHPHAMGYPPVAGYPPGHPSPPYPHNYGPYPNYVGAPPPLAPHPHGGYYPNHAYLPPHGPPNQQPGMMLFGFIRGVLAAIVILFLISAVFSIITYIIIRPQQLSFRLASFSVANFNISNAVLTASWEARVIVENPNEKLEAYFDRVQSCLYYKEPTDYLAYNLEGPISVGTRSNGTMVLRNSMVNGEQPKRSVVEEIEKERKGGAVSLGLAIRLLGILKTGTSTTVLPEHLQVSCEDIKLVFGAGSMDGTLVTGDEPRECSIYT